jgi:hypothetical protein
MSEAKRPTSAAFKKLVRKEPALELLGRTRIRHMAEQLHALGPRSLAKLLLEVAAGSDLWDRLEVYCQLNPAIVRNLGSDDFTAEATANATAFRVFGKSG